MSDVKTPARLSTQCRCGKKGKALHEMGACPEVQRTVEALRAAKTPAEFAQVMKGKKK